MKKIYHHLPAFAILLLAILFSGSDSISMKDGYYYWYKGEKHPLYLKSEKRFILFSEAPDTSELTVKLGLDAMQIQDLHKFVWSNTLVSYNYDAQEEVREETYWTVLTNLSDELDLATLDIVYEAPFFTAANGTELGLSHLFYVKLFKAEDIIELEKLARRNHVKILGNNVFMPLWYTLACEKSSKGNALAMANLFYESGLFSASQPDLMEDDLAYCVNDPFLTISGTFRTPDRQGE